MNTKLDRAIDAFLNVYGDLEGLERAQFHAILADHLADAISDAENAVQAVALTEHRRTLHTVPTALDCLAKEVVARQTNAAVEWLLNAHNPVGSELECARFISH